MARRKSLRLKLLIGAAAVAAVLAIAAVLWVARLDRLVTQQFKGRLWSVPARVYAEPLDLYAGAPISADDLEDELRRLSYRSGDPAAGPGLYRRRGGEFDLQCRRARFADELRDPVRVSIRAGSASITALSRDDGKELPVFRLDPPLMGSVFPVHGEDRIVLSPAEVPALLRGAIKAVEDRRFDEHHGVDLLGITRAMWADLKARRFTQGGSTLTQQLVKNYFLSDEQTFSRKLTEAVMALRLEAHFTKDEILVAYLNEVFLGQDGQRAIHGFGLGSEYYFGKPLAEADVSQVALLVGLVKGPSYYDPRKHPDRARTRRNLVLKQLADERLIDAATAARAAAEPLGLRPPGAHYMPAFMDLVRRNLKRDYAEADLAAAGLAVFTTFDPRAQAAAQRALTRNLARLDAASRVRGDHLDGAVVIAEPNSGDVVAVVGGRDVEGAGFDRALDARRPIGSLVKPAIYLTAIETGRYNAATILEDEAIELKMPDGSVWAPQNFERNTNGRVPMVRALAESLNLATVRLGLDLGLPAVADTLQKLGLERRPVLNPSMLLGTVEMTPLEVLQMYTTLANGGFRARLRTVRAVLDEQGRPLRSFKVQVEAAAPPAAIYQLDRMLTVVTTHGTGRGAAAHLPPGTVVAGKTGTSSDTRDSWFSGITGSYLAVVWVGYDDNRETGLTGAAGALPIWADTVGALRSSSFEPIAPEQIEDRSIGYLDGLETPASCAGSTDVVSIAVPPGTQLPANPACGGSPTASPADKIKSWIKSIVH
jgi:penicillin-binding protein 1B